MTGFDVYKKYVAIKTHFNDCNYDYIKHKGRINATYSSYTRRKDRNFFEKLAKKRMDYVIPFLVANFVADKNLWIGELVINEESFDIYFEWRRKISRLFSHSKMEMEKIRAFLNARNLSFNDLFAVEEGTQPIIFRLVLQRFISIETYIIMDTFLDFSSRFDRLLKNDFIYEQWSTKIKAYAPFLNLDKEKCRNVIKEVFLKEA